MLYRKKLTALASFSLLFALTTCPSLQADVAPPPHMATRVAVVDVIVAGRVVALEDQDRLVDPYPGSTIKLPYRIAVVQVTENLLGTKGQKTVRIGFQVPPKSGKPFYRYAPQFQVNQEGMFFLKKHFQEPFYIAPNYYDFINQNNNPAFTPERDEIRRLARLLENPIASLKSRDAEERLQTAAVLIARHRLQFASVPGKAEPIDAAESRLILRALATADWSKARKYTEVSPPLLFSQLRIGPREGYQPKGNWSPSDQAAAMRAWLQEHSGTYRIQRFVPAK